MRVDSWGCIFAYSSALSSWSVIRVKLTGWAPRKIKTTQGRRYPVCQYRLPSHYESQLFLLLLKQHCSSEPLLKFRSLPMNLVTKKTTTTYIVSFLSVCAKVRSFTSSIRYMFLGSLKRTLNSTDCRWFRWLDRFSHGACSHFWHRWARLECPE